MWIYININTYLEKNKVNYFEVHILGNNNKNFLEDDFNLEIESSHKPIKKTKKSDTIYFFASDLKDKTKEILKDASTSIINIFTAFKTKTKFAIICVFVLICVISAVVLTTKAIHRNNEKNNDLLVFSDNINNAIDSQVSSPNLNQGTKANEPIYKPNDINSLMNNNEQQFENLRLKYNNNQDIIAYISVFDTYINSPVVKYTDNIYYQDHDLSNNESIDGAVYFDASSDIENFGQNTIIYGRTDIVDKQFYALTLFEDEKYFEQNRYINLDTIYNNSTWKVYSFYTIEDDSYYLKNSFIGDEFKTYVAGTKNMSTYNIDETVSEYDKILTLTSTNLSGKRYVLHAKLDTFK